MYRKSTCMDDTLGNPLMVEVGHLFTEMEVFHQCGAAFTGLERKLIFALYHRISLREV